jgi:hypothetical protein
MKITLLLLLGLCIPTSAQGQVPFLIKFTGSIRDLRAPMSGGPIGVVFALYKDESGGASLWSELQNVTLDSQGHFTVLLGSASGKGVPPDAFLSGEARWIGLTPDDGVERPRTMLTSVPYAFEAASAQTLAGRVPDDFVTQDQLRLSHGPIRRLCQSQPCGPVSYGSTASSFEANAPVGPSFISDAASGPPLSVRSSTLVPNFNADLLHGFTDSAFAKLNTNNQFFAVQQFSAGVVLPPIPGNGTTAEPSSPQDATANGIVGSGLVNQTFRWQANGSNQNLPQAQFSLLFGSNGQTPQPTGFSLNSDGSINFAASQSFPGSAVMTAIIPLLQADGYGGGSQGGTGGGAVSETPTGTQPVTQPPGTSLNVNTFNNIRTVEATDNWVVGNLPSPLSAGVQASVTITPCPRGIDTSGNLAMGGPLGGYPIRIIDGSQPNTNSETAYVTGGTCTSAGSTGTIIFTPYLPHAALNYTIGSASSGIQEAINDACGTNPTTWQNSNCEVVIPPTGPQSQQGNYGGFDVYDTIYFHSNSSLLSGYGAILNCHERGPCVQVGDLRNANDYANNTVEGISFRSPDNRSSDPAFNGSLIKATQRISGVITIQTATPHNLRSGDRVTQMLTDTSNYWGDVPFITVTDGTHYTYSRTGTPDLASQTTPGLVALSYEAMLDNGESTSLIDLQYANSYEYGTFNHFLDFWDDENAAVSNFNNNAIPLNDSPNWTGSFIWSGGALNLPDKTQQLAPVITVSNSNFTANGSNCATIYNSNGFHVQNSVCQAQGPWEFLVTTINGNYQGADFQNIYSEANLSVNPANPAKSPWPGLGVAGFIGGPTSGAGTYTLGGQGGFGGAMPTVGSGSITYVYYVVAKDVTMGTQTSPLPFMYEQENSPSQVTVRWPRLAANTDTVLYDLIRNPAPAGTMDAAAGGYLAPYAGGCNGGSNSTCGSVALDLPQCIGFVCSFSDNTGNATSAYGVKNGNFIPNPTFWPGTAVLSSTPLMSAQEVPVTGIAFGGAPAEYASYCTAYGVNVSGGYTVCSGTQTASNNSVPDQPAFILTDGNSRGGGGVPGAKGRLIFETTADSEAAYHQVITLLDSNPAKTQATTGHRPVGDPGDMFQGIDPNGYLMIGGGAHGIAQYVNNIGDGSNWLESLTPSLKAFKVLLQAPTINVTTGFQINGSFGLPGQVPVSTGNGTVWGSCGGNGSYEVDSKAHVVSGFSKLNPAVNGGLTNGSSTDAGDTASSPMNPASSLRVRPHFSSESSAKTAHSFAGASSIPEPSSARTSVSIPFLSSIADGACDDRTFRWEGATTSDPLIPGWPADLASGLIGSVFVSSADTVTVRLCNFATTATKPGVVNVTAILPHSALSAKAELTFGMLKNGSCAAKNFSLMGVSAGAPIVPGWPIDLGPGTIGVMRANADNSVEVRLCNFSGRPRQLPMRIFGVFVEK